LFGFDFNNGALWKLFQKKLAEKGLDPDLAIYTKNIGRSESEILDMESRIEKELYDVLTGQEQLNFNLGQVLEGISRMVFLFIYF